MSPIPVAWAEKDSKKQLGSVCARLKKFLKDRPDIHNLPYGTVSYKLMDPAERARNHFLSTHSWVRKSLL